jgi:hypothetical protein
MADRLNATDAPASITQLVGGIMTDVHALVHQEFKLAKTEMHEEWGKTKLAAESMVVGAGLVTVAALLVSFAIVYAMAAAAPGLPMWACFLIIGLAWGLIGGLLLRVGRNQASEVHVIPPQTAASLKEDVQWLNRQT